MTVPSVVQVSPVQSNAAHSGAITCTFGAGVSAGNTVVLVGRVFNVSATDLPGVTSNVTMTGGTFQRKLDKTTRYGLSGMTLWIAEGVSAGATAVVWTPSLANGQNYTTLVAIEIDGKDTSAYETAVGSDSEDGSFGITIGPAPAVGSISQADTLALFATWADGSTVVDNIGWQLPSGWTQRAKTDSAQSGLRPIFVGTKTQTATDAISVTVNSTNADVSGRSGILLIIRGQVVAPSPPPPAPTPTPPPPAEPPPPPAPTPGPPSAPMVPMAFQFLNLDPTLAGVVTDLIIQIHALPTTQPFLGAFIQGSTGQAFVGAGSYSKVVVTHDGVNVVTVGQSVVAVGRNAGGTAGFRGPISGTVIAL